jgi:hypothetical protein
MLVGDAWEVSGMTNERENAGIGYDPCAYVYTEETSAEFQERFPNLRWALLVRHPDSRSTPLLVNLFETEPHGAYEAWVVTLDAIIQDAIALSQ